MFEVIKYNIIAIDNFPNKKLRTSSNPIFIDLQTTFVFRLRISVTRFTARSSRRWSTPSCGARPWSTSRKRSAKITSWTTRTSFRSSKKFKILRHIFSEKNTYFANLFPSKLSESKLNVFVHTNANKNLLKKVLRIFLA